MRRGPARSCGRSGKRGRGLEEWPGRCQGILWRERALFHHAGKGVRRSRRRQCRYSVVGRFRLGERNPKRLSGWKSKLAANAVVLLHGLALERTDSPRMAWEEWLGKRPSAIF